jgi:GntR family transcriptional regulator, transcriptional repressor for pyruvate dehydrogenase complex
MSMPELRICLEVDAAGLAAARRTDEHVAEMLQILESFEASLEAPEASADGPGV